MSEDNRYRGGGEDLRSTPRTRSSRRSSGEDNRRGSGENLGSSPRRRPSGPRPRP